MGFRPIEDQAPRSPIEATADNIESFIKRSTADIPDAGLREEVAGYMRGKLDVGADDNDPALSERVWRKCEKADQPMQGDFEKTQTKLLGDLFCSADAIDKAAVSGTVTNWLNPHLFVDKQLDTFGQMLARELQGRSVEDCPHLKVLNPGTVQLISSATAQTAPDDPRPDTTTPPP